PSDLARHRPGRTPARRRLPLAAATSAGLDGLRHGRAAAPRGRTHGHLAARRLVPAGGLQPQAADEETLGRNPAVPGPVRQAGATPAGGARAPALPRPRGDHGLRRSVRLSRLSERPFSGGFARLTPDSLPPA